MLATFNPTSKTKYTTSHRKEKGFAGAYIAVTPGGKVVAELRIYWPASTAYACFWVHNPQINTSGSGSAGGYGYCKESAAAGEALRNAGFTLSENISGVGRDAIRAAVLAVAVAAGYPDAFVIHSHP
jgi:hypothetical protein